MTRERIIKDYAKNGLNGSDTIEEDDPRFDQAKADFAAGKPHTKDWALQRYGEHTQGLTR